MASFQINQPSPGPGEPDASRFDLVAGEVITLYAVEPSGADISYQWEIIDRAGTSSSLSSSNGDSVTVEAQPGAPFAFLVEMRVYTKEVLTGTVRRAFGARSPNRGLRLPLFAETADPSAKLAARNVPASTDNAAYENRAGTGSSEQNWRGWTEFLHELVMAAEEGGGGVPGRACVVVQTQYASQELLPTPDLSSCSSLVIDSQASQQVQSLALPADPTQDYGLAVMNIGYTPLVFGAASVSAASPGFADFVSFNGAPVTLLPGQKGHLAYSPASPVGYGFPSWLVVPDQGTIKYASKTCVTDLYLSNSGDLYTSVPVESCSHLALNALEAGVYVGALQVPEGAPWEQGIVPSVLLTNTGWFALELRHDASSEALFADLRTQTGSTVTLQPGQSAVLVYNHDQQLDLGAPATGASGDGGWWVFPVGGGGGAGNLVGPGTVAAGSLAAFADDTHLVEAGIGVVSGSLSLASGKTVDGRDVSVDGAKLDGVEAGAQVTSLARINTATGRVAATDGAKLDGVEAGAQVTSAARVATALAASTAALSVNNQKITNLADPANPQDAATRAYVLANAGAGGGGGGDTIVGRAIPDLTTVLNAPLGHWVFGANGTVDLSGNARTLTVGAPVPPGASIDFVNATGYFGGGGYYLSTHASFQLLTNLTIEAVINVNAAGGVIAMCGAAGESESTNHHYDFEVVTGGFLYFLCESGAGANATAQSTGVVPLNEWVHVAVTRATDGRSVEFFINGFSAGTAMLASAASAVGGSTASLGVMRDITGGGTSLSGSAALLAIYGTTLTSAQVFDLAKRRLGVGSGEALPAAGSSTSMTIVAVPAAWKTLLDLNLTKEPAKTFTDGLNYWNGFNWIGKNIAAATDSFSIVPGTGLVLDHNATNTDWAATANSAPRISLNCNQIPGFELGKTSVRIRALMEISGADAATELGRFGFESVPYVANGRSFWLWSAGWTSSYQALSSVLLGSTVPATPGMGVYEKVYEVVYRGLEAVEFRAKTMEAAYSDDNRTEFSGRFALNSFWKPAAPSLYNVYTSGDNGLTIVLGAQSGNATNSLVVTWRRLCIEYLYSGTEQQTSAAAPIGRETPALYSPAAQYALNALSPLVDRTGGLTLDGTTPSTGYDTLDDVIPGRAVPLGPARMYRNSFINLCRQMTMTCRIFARPGIGDSVVVGCANSAGSLYQSIAQIGTGRTLYSYIDQPTTGGSGTRGDLPVPFGRWVFIAVRRRADGFMIWNVEGQQQVSTTVWMPSGDAATTFYINSNGYASASGLAIADMSFWTTALSDAQVAEVRASMNLAPLLATATPPAVDLAVKWRDVLDLVLGDQTPVAVSAATAQQEIQLGPIKAYTHDWSGKIANAGLDANGLRLKATTAYHTWYSANPANSADMSPTPGLFIPFPQLAGYDPMLPVSAEILFGGTGIRNGNSVNVAIVYASTVAVGGAGTTVLDRNNSGNTEFVYMSAVPGWSNGLNQSGYTGGTYQIENLGGAELPGEHAFGVIKIPGGHFVATHGVPAGSALPEVMDARLEANTNAVHSRRVTTNAIASGAWGVSLSVGRNNYNAPIEPAAADVYIKRLRIRQRGIYLAAEATVAAPATVITPSSDWQTYCDFNFTQMPNQTISQGINVIDGVQMRADFVANATTFAIVNGTGLYVKNNTVSSSFYYSGRNAPMIFVDLPVDVPGWLLDSSEVRISAEWAMTAVTGDYSASGFGVAKHPFVGNQDLSVHWLHQRATTVERRLSRLYGSAESSPIVSGTYNTGMIHFRSQYENAWYGKNNGAANSVPNATVLDPKTMTLVGSIAESRASVTLATYIPNLDHLIAFWTGHSDNTLGTSEHVCKRLRIEYRLAASSSAAARTISGDWETALDLNLTQDAAFTFVDGTQTWHGYPTVGKNIASGSLQAAVVPGTGLVIQANTTNTDISGNNDTGPQVQMPLDALIPRFVVGSSRVRVHIQWRVIADADIELALFGIRRPWKDTTSAHMFCLGRGYNSYSGGANYYVASQNIGTTSTGSGNLTKTDNLGCIETDGFITRYFSCRSTAPLSDANSAVLDMTKQACVFRSDGSAGTVGKVSELSVFFGALTLNTGRDVQLVVERLRIEYKL